MSKQIIGSIVILVGLGLATFFVYQVYFPPGDLQTSAADPAAEQQAAVQPATESPPQPESTAADPAGATAPVTPPAPQAASAEAVAPDPAPASSDPIALAAKAPMAGAPVPPGPGAPTAGAPTAGARVPEAQAAASSPPPAEPETAALSPLEPREEHGLLAGRYRGFTSAKKRLEKIKEQDLPAFVRPKGRFYEVWAGPFATTDEAQQARKSLKAVKISAKMGKLVIPVPK